MLKFKKKGLFVDISEFSILAVRTSGYETPIVVEEVAVFPVESDYSLKDVRAFFGQRVDIKGGNYAAKCGISPKDRFVHYHEVESGVPHPQRSKTRNAVLLRSKPMSPHSNAKMRHWVIATTVSLR